MATEQSVMALIRASRPTFKNVQDKLVFALHASFIAAGYVLNATGPPAFFDDALTDSSSDESSIDEWNSFEDNYAFVYSSPEKDSKNLLLKCLVMNNKLLVDALKDGNSTSVHHEFNTADFVEEDGGTNYSSHYKNLGKLVNSINNEILNKCSTSSSSQGIRSDLHSPDPEPQHHPPLYEPSRGRFGDSDGGGNMLGPNHPIFGGIGRGPNFPGGVPPNIPPGARFDPFGPPGVPGFEPNRFVRDPRKPRGGDTHPDLEHFGSGSDLI